MNQTPEELARDNIDRQLAACGWVVQHKKQIDLNAGIGVAVREYQTEVGPADYILFVDRKPVGVIEAKKEEEGVRLTVVEGQLAEYAASRLKHLHNDPLHFVYESTGSLTRFTDYRDPKPRSRPVFRFHRPETFREGLKKPKSLRERLRDLPLLPRSGLRDCQITATTNLEDSFKANKPRALIQMATGSGKTFAAITAIYRLLRYADAKRILFLVDTRNLGEQAEQEFMAYLPNDDNRKFTELYKEQWSTMGTDVKGKIYEGLLEKNAEDTKSGAGQYFTPRSLIKAMVECLRPEPLKTIADPACGTGGFFLAAYDYILAQKGIDKEDKGFLKYKTFYGNEIVAGARRLALMNMFLHNIGDIDSDTFISPTDSLVADSGLRVDYVLTNPPFGKKSSMTFTNEEGEQEKEDLTYNRQDFWATTSNKQLNFVQHICTMLKTTGKAAVVVPDNVLFEGGAGETVRKRLLESVDLHTILRLPTGIFYAQGVKANVLFFDAKPAAKESWTKEIWYYDYRTNIHHTLKKNPLKLEDLRHFIQCYHPENRHIRNETWHPETNQEGQWRKFTYDEIVNRDKTNLDIFWLRDKSLADLDNLPDPDVLANDIIENLEAAVESFKEIAQRI